MLLGHGRLAWRGSRSAPAWSPPYAAGREHFERADQMDFDVHCENERLARALKELEAGEAALRETTAKLEKRLNEHARAALETGTIDFGSNLLAHRK